MVTTRKKSKLACTAPEAVIYTKLTLPASLPPGTSQRETLRETITLQTQGEAVEVSEKYPIPLLMIAFDVVHRVSPEMVLRLNSGKRILLFEHWGSAVLRDEDIEAIGKTSKEKKAKEFVPELIIDIGAIWKKRRAKEEDLKAIENALGEIEKQIRPAMITTLIGKAPALLFLLVQHLLYGKTGEIWYQENAASNPIPIKQV